MKRKRKFVIIKTETILFLLLLTSSVVSWLFFHYSSLTLAYNDAMSHINIARLTIDNQEPGLAQLGSVWLPMSHVLSLPLVWNDALWKSGLSGIIISMVSYIFSGILLYKIVFLLTKNKLAAAISLLAFAINLNIIYLQSTPLTEPLFVFLFVLSTYITLLWLTKKHSEHYLLIMGVLGFFMVLTRYDGWFVVLLQGLSILYSEKYIFRATYQEMIGKSLLFGLPILFGVSLWILWNFLIFGNPLYFIYGPYSAHAQQEIIDRGYGLITKGNIFLSIKAYFFSVFHNIGEWVLWFTALGFFVYTFLLKSLNNHKKLIFLSVLVSPILFNTIALYLGFSILNVPELNWNPSGNPSGYWFNVRYGVFALPLACVMIGIFANWKKVAVPIAFLVIAMQTLVTYQNGIITIIDGTKGSSAFRHHGISDALGKSMSKDDQVLMSLGHFNPVAFKSNISLKQIIHEGVSKKWEGALARPEEYAEFIVVGKKDAGETVEEALVDKRNSEFLTYFEAIYSDSEGTVYKRIAPDPIAERTEE